MTERPTARVREDRGCVLEVESDALAAPQPAGEAEGDDSARRGAGDQVEMVGENDPEVLLDGGENRRGKKTTNAAPVEGQDLEPSGRYLVLKQRTSTSCLAGETDRSRTGSYRIFGYGRVDPAL